MLIKSVVPVSLLLALGVESSAAQNALSSRDSLPEFVRRSALTVSFVQTRPQGALGKNIGLGYGVSGSYLFRIDRTGLLSIRADLGVVGYGNESKRVALSETVGGRVQVNVRTTNYIVPMSIGPQLSWPTGPVRPYVNVGLGGQGFVTESRVEDVNTSTAFASTTNQSDFASSWVAGGGIYSPIYDGKVNVALDLGAQYMNGAAARYLAPGSIVDLPGGEIRITPSSSTTHLLVVRLGVRIGL